MAEPKKGSLLDKLRIAFPNFVQSKAFIEYFALTTATTSDVMQILKNKGLDKTSYKQCYQLSRQLRRNSITKKSLQAWLKKNSKVQKELQVLYKQPALPLLVSSDIIESLFGCFKQIIARSPQADMNRSVLLIPALCGKVNDQVITQALSNVSHQDLKEWENENIPYTMQKKRHEFFNKNIQKAG